MVACGLLFKTLKQHRLLACAACSLLLTACNSAARKPLTLEKPKEVIFDQRQWTRVQQNDPRFGADFTLEYLPQDQTKRNWQELLTEQFFGGPDTILMPRAGNAPLQNQINPMTADAFAGVYQTRLQRNNAIRTLQRDNAGSTATIYWSGTVRDVVPKEMSTMSQPAPRGPHQDENGLWHFTQSPGDLAGELKELIWNSRNRSKGPTFVGSEPNQELDLVLISQRNAGIHVWQYCKRVPAGSSNSALQDIIGVNRQRLFGELAKLP
jgi:hypothetical protein